MLDSKPIAFCEHCAKPMPDNTRIRGCTWTCKPCLRRIASREREWSTPILDALLERLVAGTPSVPDGCTLIMGPASRRLERRFWRSTPKMQRALGRPVRGAWLPKGAPRFSVCSETIHYALMQDQEWHREVDYPRCADSSLLEAAHRLLCVQSENVWRAEDLMATMDKRGDNSWTPAFFCDEYFRLDDFYFHAQFIMAVLTGERLNQSLIRRILSGTVFVLPGEARTIAEGIAEEFMSAHGDLPFGVDS